MERNHMLSQNKPKTRKRKSRIPVEEMPTTEQLSDPSQAQHWLAMLDIWLLKGWITSPVANSIIRSINQAKESLNVANMLREVETIRDANKRLLALKAGISIAEVEAILTQIVNARNV